MSSKEPQEAVDSRGVSDIVGIVLVCASFLLLVSLFSFDRNDLESNRVPANEHVSNWVGPVGAHVGNGLFLVFGMSAYLLPVLMLGLGLAHLFQSLIYLKKRWPWALLLLISTVGGFDLYSWMWQRSIKETLNIPSAGGFLGMALNRYLFAQYFGQVGAGALFGTMYLISLIGLTNIPFGHWLQTFWHRINTPGGDGGPKDEKALEKQARALAKEVKKLEAEAANSGLSADLQPIPPITIRDLSVSQSAAAQKKKGAEVTPEAVLAPVEPGAEVIPATEVAAATTADVLGHPAESGSKSAMEKQKESEEEPSDKAPATEAPLHVSPPTRSKTLPHKNRPLSVASAPIIGNYKLPPMELLNYPDPNVKPTESKEDLMANARLMQNTLAQFDIEVALGDITKGPTITRYELHPAPGVRLEKITALSNNLAAALKAVNVNILAPIPGKSSVGIEVPNLVKTKVIMRDLLESDEWRNTKARIPLALGKDVYGKPVIADLAEMPHLLIAGSTGSGKSVCINSITASLLYRFSPDQMRFVMIDPKVVELQQYNTLPHLVVPVVTDPKKVVLALRWVVNEMEKRYQIFARVGVRNIKSFNERTHVVKEDPHPELPLKAKKERVEASSDGFAVELDEEIVVPRDEDIVIPEKLSYIVVIIDELADLMLVAPADVEMSIARITQMARAAGIHCIVATQRPSVDVITGVIKANIPARIAFQVASRVDSRTILDGMGADKLLGKGDMLYVPPGSSRLLRAQGVFVTDQEVQSIVDFIAKQGKPSYEMDIHQQLSKPIEELENSSHCDEDEELIKQCIEVIRSEEKASVSLLQRRLRLGYTRAARIMDELEDRGIVGPSKGAEPRDILIDLDGQGADGTPVGG
jgi:S-DNA-T family DNA segregation ATPase FtsK/SpoIIIE